MPREPNDPSAHGALAISERAVALFRRYLQDSGLHGWTIYQSRMPYLHVIDEVLAKLDPSAAWRPWPQSLVGQEGLTFAFFDETGDVAPAHVQPVGVLRLADPQVVVARWYWINPESSDDATLLLVAAPDPTHLAQLRERLIRLHRETDKPVWRVVGDHGAGIVREPPADGALLLTEAIDRRIKTDVIGFFDPKVAALYKRLGVPYRRGVLLHGEPGNGKTSLIRMIGASLPDVAGLLLRPTASFDTDRLIDALESWRNLAPAIIVIEDLTTVLERVNLSTFLNLIDGVDRKTDGGLLMIASTNHPDRLDPAVSNRPGRFDVVIELPAPTAEQRRDYLTRRLPEIRADVRDKVANETDGMSFAHLAEIVQGSGLAAAAAGRESRSVEDVTATLGHVKQAADAAKNGFAPPAKPFGLAGFRGKSSSSQFSDDDIPF